MHLKTYDIVLVLSSFEATAMELWLARRNFTERVSTFEVMGEKTQNWTQVHA